MVSSGRKKITLIESEETADRVRSALAGQNIQEVDIVVRGPDAAEKDAVSAARLCGCRRVCLAVMED